MTTRDYLKNLNSFNINNLNQLKTRISQQTQQQPNSDTQINNKLILTDFENAIKVVDRQQNDDDNKNEFTNLLLPYIKDYEMTKSITNNLSMEIIKTLLINFSVLVEKLNNLQGKKITKQSLINLINFTGDELLNKAGKKQLLINSIEKDNSVPVIEAFAEKQYTEEQLNELKKNITFDKRKAKVEQLKNAVIEFYNFFDVVKKNQWEKILSEVKDKDYANSVKQGLEKIKGDITPQELEENILIGTNKRTKDFLLSILGYFKELLTAEFIKLKINQKNNNDEELGQPTAGSGLKSPNEKHIDSKRKYFINMKKLKDNILDIRYSKNRHLIPIKSQYVSGVMKSCIMSLLSGKVDKALYHKLTSTEKNLLRSLLPYFENETDFEDNDAFNKRFEVIRGEILAGNNSVSLKQEARAYLLHALNTSKISRHFYINCLHELGL